MDKKAKQKKQTETVPFFARQQPNKEVRSDDLRHVVGGLLRREKSRKA